MKAVIKASLIAGTIDILVACAKFYFETGNNPVRVLNFIASGVFGSQAFGESPWMPVSGLVFHYSITFVWAFLFYKLYPLLPRIKENRLITGLIYGLFVWGLMNQVVVPLSNTSPLPFSVMNAIIGALIVMLAVGLPISLIIGRHYGIGKKSEDH